jgi:hypothetical protein
MPLVKEDENGAYLEATPALLKKFTTRESNPNFDVFDSADGYNRLIIARSSRLPDDDDLITGRYGINFHRALPSYKEALRYKTGIPYALETRQINDLAFGADSQEEYDRKAAVWNHFYTFIWDLNPQTLWITPHSGSIARPPDEIIPWPYLEMDAYVAEIAALCALNNGNKPSKRIMISLHSHNWLGAVLDLGGFGILGDQQLAGVAKKIEAKYHHKVQSLAEECKKDFSILAMKWLTHIKNIRGTLIPEDLKEKYALDRSVVLNITRSLQLYGKEIQEFQLAEFQTAIDSLRGTELKVVSYNHLFAARHIADLIKIHNKIESALLSSALQIECLKLYLKKEPELISNIILDVKKELFGS